MSSYAEFHALLNVLSTGDRITTTWLYEDDAISIEAPVVVKGKEVESYGLTLRFEAEHKPPSDLLSISATYSNKITATSEDPDSLGWLLNSLEDGEQITVVFRLGDNETTFTGGVSKGEGLTLMLESPFLPFLRYYSGEMRPELHSVSVVRKVTKTWENGSIVG